MKQDLLREATRALREAGDRAPAAALETRARVVATLRDRRKRRLELLRLVLPLAAILIASTGWAATTGRLQRIAGALIGAGRTTHVEAPAIRATPAFQQAASVAITSTLAPASNSSEPPPAVESTPIVEPTPIELAPPAPRASAGLAASRRGGAEDSPEAHALYTAAHRAHFAERTWPGALSAWNAYLAAAPRGQFSAEAHYNRALCLVRLGREGEARGALEVFARGGYGGYRRSEAQAVLDAMGPSTAEGRAP